MNEAQRNELKSTDWLCFADIWVHTHYQTGEPVSVCVNRWNGDRHLLEAFELEDVKDMKEILKYIPTEEDVSVRIVFDRECGNGDGPHVMYPCEISLHNTESRPADKALSGPTDSMSCVQCGRILGNDEFACRYENQDGTFTTGDCMECTFDGGPLIQSNAKIGQSDERK